MKDHSIVRIHFSTGLILMKLSRPTCKKVKSKPSQFFNLLMLLSFKFYVSGHPVWKIYFLSSGFLEKRVFCFSSSIHQVKNPNPYFGVIFGLENLFQ